MCIHLSVFHLYFITLTYTIVVMLWALSFVLCGFHLIFMLWAFICFKMLSFVIKGPRTLGTMNFVPHHLTHLDVWFIWQTVNYKKCPICHWQGGTIRPWWGATVWWQWITRYEGDRTVAHVRSEKRHLCLVLLLVGTKLSQMERNNFPHTKVRLCWCIYLY